MPSGPLREVGAGGLSVYFIQTKSTILVAVSPDHCCRLGAAWDFSIVVFVFAEPGGAPVARCRGGGGRVASLDGQGWRPCPLVGPTVLPAGSV
jgi:hypothetical protein